jgi:hypothetical protein
MSFQKLLLLGGLTLLSSSLLAQSAWDIGYLNVAAISTADIGKEVKIDFNKGNQPDRLTTFRYFLSRPDTTSLKIGGSTIKLIEERKINVDWGLYREQYLRSIDEVMPGTELLITSSVIKKVTQDSILVNSAIELRTERKRQEDAIEHRFCDIWIEKNKLSGFIYKIR